MPITLRPATEADQGFLRDLVPRLRGFGPSMLRPAAAMDAAEQRAFADAVSRPDPGDAVVVAELDGQPAGAALFEEKTDYFTGERHGHLGIIIVGDHAEGQGVGKALLDACEAWARERGHRFVTLNVFDRNQRARRFYERNGWHPDAVKYVKEL